MGKTVDCTRIDNHLIVDARGFHLFVPQSTADPPKDRHRDAMIREARKIHDRPMRLLLLPARLHADEKLDFSGGDNTLAEIPELKTPISRRTGPVVASRSKHLWFREFSV
jgi:hypothetical protein